MYLMIQFLQKRNNIAHTLGMYMQVNTRQFHTKYIYWVTKCVRVLIRNTKIDNNCLKWIVTPNTAHEIKEYIYTQQKRPHLIITRPCSIFHRTIRKQWNLSIIINNITRYALINHNWFNCNSPTNDAITDFSIDELWFLIETLLTLKVHLFCVNIKTAAIFLDFVNFQTLAPEN